MGVAAMGCPTRRCHCTMRDASVRHRPADTLEDLLGQRVGIGVCDNVLQSFSQAASRLDAGSERIDAVEKATLIVGAGHVDAVIGSSARVDSRSQPRNDTESKE